MSYDMIDRFLRNNLDDDNYAEYSAALDELCTTPPQRKPLTDEEIGEFYYGITHQRWSSNGSWLKTFARAIEAAHNITGEKMMTVRDLLKSPIKSSPDGKHWEPALPFYLWWRIRMRDAWAVWKGEATAIRQTTKADIEVAHGIKG